MADKPAPQSNLTSGRTLLATYLAPMWPRALLLLILLLISTGFILLSPRLLGQFIDAVFGQGNVDSALGIGLLFIAIALGSQVLTVVTKYMSSDIGLRATNQLRADLTLHCLHLDLSFHHKMSAGVLVERIDGDVSKLNDFLSNFAVLLVQNALLILGAMAAAFLLDWRAGLTIALFVVAVLVALEILRRKATPHVRQEREASAQLMGTLEELMTGFEDLRGNGAEGYAQRRLLERSRAWAPAYTRAHLFGGMTYTIGSMVAFTGLALTLAVAAWLVARGILTIGEAYVLYRYVELIRWPLQNVGRQMQDLQQAGAAIMRIQELLALTNTVLDHGKQTLPARAIGVTLDHIHFAYAPISQPIYALRDLSFHLPPGAVLGLLGRTGSGKTTVTRLLFRHYEPTSGVIALDGLPLPSLSLAALRGHVGLVTQEVHLFQASVRDNLTLFAPAHSDQQLLDALRAVDLWDWFQSLPNGLDTVLPPGGALSAGQSQLLAFARVLLKDPNLVILDEASSRLDPVTEQRLESALDRLLVGRTAIIIAHRLATVRRADYILILENGEAVEYGPREALAQEPQSRFANLLRLGMDEVLA